MSHDEAALRYLEEHIPELAEAAVREAYWRALAAGNRVLVSEGGNLVEVSPDGSRRVVRPLPPKLPLTPGRPLDIP